MTRSSVEEYVDAIRDRYHRASRSEKRDVLDEFTRVTGYHRKATIRLLNTRPKPTASVVVDVVGSMMKRSQRDSGWPGKPQTVYAASDSNPSCQSW